MCVCCQTARHVDGGAVRVGRLRLGRVRRADGAALPGRARAGAGRARAHEPAQQPRGPQGERGTHTCTNCFAATASTLLYFSVHVTHRVS